MTDKIDNVLFLCTGNSTRSVLGESILTHEDKGRFHAFPVGSHPKGKVHFMDCVSAAGKACPVWPGHPLTAQWGVEGPTVVEGSDAEVQRAFAQIAGSLENRIAVFLRLPLASIDGMALERKPCQIGRMEGSTDTRDRSA